MEEFQGFFDSPRWLPPISGHEDSITLKEGGYPLSVHPYRYPQF